MKTGRALRRAAILLLVPLVAGCVGAAASPSAPLSAGASPSEPLRAGLGPTASPVPSATVPSTPTASPTGKPGTFTATGNPTPPGSTGSNYESSAALLRNGDVLYLGFNIAQLYDPGAGKFLATGQPVFSAAAPFYPGRGEAIPLDDGSVLVLGGYTQIYSTATGSFTVTGEPETPAVEGAAVLLHDGRVLSIGGDEFEWAGAKCEVYDPATGKWSPTGSMKTRRAQFAATVLRDGRVLVAGGTNETSAGGSDLASAEIYNPATGKWTATGSMTAHRSGAVATLMANGKVLIAGGDSDEWKDSPDDDGPLRSADVYDPATGKFTRTGSMSIGRDWAASALLKDGRVLVAGGGTEDADTATAEIYDPSTGKFTPTGSMTTARSMNPSILLADGRVLVVDKGSADLYWP